MITFIKGYEENNARMNEWNVNGHVIKTTFIEGYVTVIEGNVSTEELAVMQDMVDESVRIAEGYY